MLLTVTSCERIGHGGASRLERANTLASFDAALRHGIDVIEFDVRAWRGELVLAHTLAHAQAGSRLPLPAALAHLAAPRFAGVGLHLDVKHAGVEAAVLDALAAAGLRSRTTLCSQVPMVLDGFRELDPGIRVGISVGGRVARASRRWVDWRRQVLAGIADRRFDALMAQHRLVDARLLGDVRERGGRLYAWTVNERRAIEALRGLGVHGITTGDPRLFV
jgi:glycerophosphoryl diester phosphodiesterase